MHPELLGRFETDPSLPVFTPERSDRKMVYCALGCACGVDVFRMTGWPRVISGRGGFFWRSMTRVWREARLPMQDGEWVVSPFWLPLFARCHGCGREQTLFDHERVAGRKAATGRADPKESIRCRVCRRGLVELVVGMAQPAGEGDRDGTPRAVEVVTHCHRCHRQARIAWSDDGRSEQEDKLDLLYGRR
jgi:ribosomal protein S27E